MHTLLFRLKRLTSRLILFRCMIAANRDILSGTFLVAVVNTLESLTLDFCLRTGIAVHCLIGHTNHFLLKGIAAGTVGVHSTCTCYSNSVAAAEIISVGCTVCYIAIELVQIKNILSWKDSVFILPFKGCFYALYF